MTANPDSNPPGELYCPSCERTFHTGERCPNDGAKLVRLRGRIDPFIGRDLDGRYTVLEKLGQGGMGAVYRANQHSVGREVAVKVVGNIVAEPDVIKRFLREAKLASKLVHPNAVSVLDFGQTDDGLFYLVMELVTGRTLDEVLKRDRRFSPERVVRIGTQVCDALECAHALSIVHRDLKPANIMVLAHGRDLIKVLDFGLAKSLAPDQTSTTMTGAGAMLGTPAFMPPELATGQRCDGRADLYSLGCILYMLGTGRLPFESDSIHELIAMHGMEQAPVMQGVPVGLARVVDRLLAKDPGDRFQTASETREALEDCLDPSRATIYDSVQSFPHIPMLYTPASGATPLHTPLPSAFRSTLAVSMPPRPRRRWPWFALGGALAGAALAAVLVMNSSGGGGEPAQGSAPATNPTTNVGAPGSASQTVPPPKPDEQQTPPAKAEHPTPPTEHPSPAKTDEHHAVPPPPNADDNDATSKHEDDKAADRAADTRAPDAAKAAPSLATHPKHPVKTVKPATASPPPAPPAPPTPAPAPPTTNPDEPKLPF